MVDQSAMPVLWPFCSRVRPWTVSTVAPAATTMRAYARERSGESRIRILAVTGMGRFWWRVVMREAIRSQSSCRKAP